MWSGRQWHVCSVTHQVASKVRMILAVPRCELVTLRGRVCCRTRTLRTLPNMSPACVAGHARCEHLPTCSSSTWPSATPASHWSAASRSWPSHASRAGGSTESSVSVSLTDGTSRVSHWQPVLRHAFLIDSLYYVTRFSLTACQLYGAIAGFFGFNSIATLAFVSMDRYFVISNPFEAMRKCTKRRAMIQVGEVCRVEGFNYLASSSYLRDVYKFTMLIFLLQIVIVWIWSLALSLPPVFGFGL